MKQKQKEKASWQGGITVAKAKSHSRQILKMKLGLDLGLSLSFHCIKTPLYVTRQGLGTQYYKKLPQNATFNKGKWSIGSLFSI